MMDKTIVRIAEESCKVLAKMTDSPAYGGDQRCGYLLPSYNALIQAARANHPDDPFLAALPSVEPNGERDPSAVELHVLFAQIRIGLESLATETVVHAVAEAPGPGISAATRRREILTSLREGRLTAEEAAALLEAL